MYQLPNYLICVHIFRYLKVYVRSNTLSFVHHKPYPEELARMSTLKRCVIFGKLHFRHVYVEKCVIFNQLKTATNTIGLHATFLLQIHQ